MRNTCGHPSLYPSHTKHPWMTSHGAKLGRVAHQAGAERLWRLLRKRWRGPCHAIPNPGGHRFSTVRKRAHTGQAKLGREGLNISKALFTQSRVCLSTAQRTNQGQGGFALPVSLPNKHHPKRFIFFLLFLNLELPNDDYEKNPPQTPRPSPLFLNVQSS